MTCRRLSCLFTLAASTCALPLLLSAACSRSHVGVHAAPHDDPSQHTGDGDGDGDGADTPLGDGDVVLGEDRPALCRFDAPEDAEAVVFAGLQAGKLLFVRGDGSIVVAHAFNGGMNVRTGEVTAHGNFIAAEAAWYDAEKLAGREHVLFDRTGTLRWQKSWGADAARVYQVGYLSEQGDLAVPLLGADTNQIASGVIIDVAGNERALTSMVPVAEVASDGFAPVATEHASSARPDRHELFWLGPASMEIMAERGPDPYGAKYLTRLIHGRFLYLAERDGKPVLVSEKHGESFAIRLPIAVEPYDFVDANDSWVLLSAGSAPLVRVNLGLGTTATISVGGVQGLRPVSVGSAKTPQSSWYDTQVRLEDDGWLLAGMRDDKSAALYMSEFGTEWTRLGDTMGEIGLIDVLSHAQTRLALGLHWSNVSFIKPDETGPFDHPQGVLEVVRPNGKTRVLEDADPSADLSDVQLSPDGKCAAYLSAGNLRVLDILLDETRDLIPADPGLNGNVSLLMSASAWVPGAR